jgi:hypothetical protein
MARQKPGLLPVGGNPMAGTALSALQRFYLPNKRNPVTLGTILLILLILLLVGALPSWPYSRGWGYYPSGGLGLILIIVIVLVLLNRV